MQPESHVDLKNGILYNRLKQIKLDNDIDSEWPEKIPVWSCYFDPKTTSKFLNLVKVFNDDDLKHLKRLIKIDDKIRGLICPGPESTKEEIKKLFKDAAFEYHDLELVEVPAHGAKSIETTLKWASIWPLNWKGNPNHQMLNKLSFDIEYESKMVNKLLETLQENTEFVSVTIFVKNNHIELIETNKFEDKLHPQDHAIMKSIDKIAKNELYKRKNYPDEEIGYLCNGYHVYSTHEPCVMCSMALAHSRINKFIYLKETNSGGMASSYYLGDRDGLNWKFQIWKWIGSDEVERINELIRVRQELKEY
ncbi:unnamed protein product [Candida verbasci]|uniref:CMP/dCMP-type deaminase domain-containing protein n=1 Tax=Candida verbasci TaxID=1227364 RepID=A0A9W4TUD2_9ASCO|nr:unnamed protein product [Candida verbasci]